MKSPSPLMELLHHRKSTRSYLDKPVEREKILECIEAARLAPSACNSQPWHFVVIDKPEFCQELAAKTLLPFSSLNQFTREVPVFVVIVTEPAKISASLGALVKGTNYKLIDIGIAAQQFCLRAEELALGTCMLGWFHHRKIKKLLGIPRGKGCDLIIALGYPKENKPSISRRKKREQIYSFNSYGG